MSAVRRMRRGIQFYMRCYGAALFCIALMVGNTSQAAQVLHWRRLEKGFSYLRMIPNPAEPDRAIDAFLIDLKHYHLELSQFSLLRHRGMFASQMLSQAGSVLAINGGFFSPDLDPIGLRLSQYRLLSPMKRISWWGIFMVQGNQAKIVSTKQYRYSKDTSLAIQAGPRLVINGYIPPLSGTVAQRSAIGMTASGQVVIAITTHLLLTTTELAEMLRAPLSQGGLACVNALNLDGGSSSQLMARTHGFLLHIASIRPVADFIVVVKNHQH